MKSLVNCTNWREYQGLNGWIMFCSAGAFGKTLSSECAEEIGCTMDQRSVCMRLMEQNLGYQLVPEIIEVPKEQPVAANAFNELTPGDTCTKSLDKYPDDMTTGMVADYLDITDESVLELIENGTIPGMPVGNDYLIPKQVFEHHV